MPEPAVAERASRARPIMAPNLFAIGFGLVGLAGAWDAAARSLGVPEAIGIVLGIVATAFWAGQCALYLVQRWRVAGRSSTMRATPSRCRS